MRTEQTVAEMVVVALGRQAEALSKETGRPLEEALAQVLKTPAGRLLGELADGPHRHEKAADWQEGLITDRVAERSYGSVAHRNEEEHLRRVQGGYWDDPSFEALRSRTASMGVRTER